MTLAFGTSGVGTLVPLAGRVRDLRARAAHYADVALDWSAEANPGGTTDARVFALYLDGRLVRTVAQGGPLESAVTGLVGDSHDMTVVPVPYGETPAARHYDLLGDRAVLDWEPATDAGVVAYAVLWDAGEGGDPETVLATTTRIECRRAAGIGPDTGTGMGRADLAGDYNGTAAINAAGTIEIDGAGVLSWALAGASGTVDFDSGETISLPLGVRVTMLDAPTAYEVGDVWNLSVGPSISFVSEALAPGVYRFAVAAQDAAGNQSDPSGAVVVAVATVPGPVTGVALTWDSEANALTATWTDPAALDTVEVYSNFDGTLDDFVDHVHETGAAASIAAGTEAVTFTFPEDAAGVLRFYLRPVLLGIERPDLGMQTFNVPPLALDLGLVLGAPFLLAATAGPAGVVVVTWAYGFRDGDDCSGFDVWIVSGAVDYTDPPTATVLATTGEGFPASAYTYTSGALSAGTYTVAVRAATAGGVRSPIGSTVSVVADPDPPAYSGALTGGPA